MKTLSTQVLAQVQAAIEAGDKNGAIIRDLKQDGHKVSAAQVNEVRASLVVSAEITTSGSDVVVLDGQPEIVVVDPVNDKTSKLAAMLAASQQLQAAAPAVRASRATVVTTRVPHSKAVSEDGSSRRRRNYEVQDRKVTVFTSESSKEVFVATNLAFTVRTYEGAIAYAKRDKALVKRAPMFANADLKMTIISTQVPVGEELDVAKARAMDEYIALGYTLVGKRPKVTVPALEVIAEPEAITTEQVQELEAEFSETLA